MRWYSETLREIRQTSLLNVLFCSLPALLLSAACLLPYLNKAFTIDDPVFLLQAQQIRKAPLDPTAMQICWTEDDRCGPVSNNSANNLFMSYYLVPALVLGGQEWLVHLLQLITLWFGIAATVSLAMRFGTSVFGVCAAGLIVAATPPVLAMTSTAMPDVLAMSLGVIGIERLWAWKQDRRFFQGVFAALALGLAPFTRMHLALLWPIALLLLRNDTHLLNVRSWWAIRDRCWPVIAAVLVWVVALSLTTEHHGSGGLGFFWLYLANMRHNFRSYLIEWVDAMPLGVAWLILRNRKINPWILTAAAVLVVWKIWTRSGFILWIPLCAIVGALVLADVFLWSFKSRDLRRIALALWLLLPLAALPYLHLPVKYLVPCAPAAALLIVDLLQNFPWRATALGGIVAVGVVWGSLVLHADARFADIERQAVARLIAPHTAARQRVWFASQWGFYWYALKAGARPLWTGDVPAPGDYLARGDLEGYSKTLTRLPPATLVETWTPSGSGGRTMSPKHGAGLYTNLFGDLMWTWGTGEWDHYELWRFR